MVCNNAPFFCTATNLCSNCKLRQIEQTNQTKDLRNTQPVLQTKDLVVVNDPINYPKLQSAQSVESNIEPDKPAQIPIISEAKVSQQTLDTLLNKIIPIKSNDCTNSSSNSFFVLGRYADRVVDYLTEFLRQQNITLYPGMCWAGGSFCRVMNNIPVTNNQDIDLWVNNEESLLRSLSQLFASGDCISFAVKKCMIVATRKTGCPIQYIYTTASPLDVISRFDSDHLKAGLIAHAIPTNSSALKMELKVWLSLDYMEAWSTMKTVVKPRYHQVFYNRLKKAYDLGFEITNLAEVYDLVYNSREKVTKQIVIQRASKLSDDRLYDYTTVTFKQLVNQLPEPTFDLEFLFASTYSSRSMVE